MPDHVPVPRRSLEEARVTADHLSDLATAELERCVARARFAGVPWRTIAAGLQLSKSEAHRRYRHLEHEGPVLVGVQVENGVQVAYFETPSLPGERFYRDDLARIQGGTAAELAALLAQSEGVLR